MRTYQLTMFNPGDTLQDYRNRISAYFVKQENDHTVRKVQDRQFPISSLIL
jgi:hypothetical protein